MLFLFTSWAVLFKLISASVSMAVCNQILIWCLFIFNYLMTLCRWLQYSQPVILWADDIYRQFSYGSRLTLATIDCSKLALRNGEIVSREVADQQATFHLCQWLLFCVKIFYLRLLRYLYWVVLVYLIEFSCTLNYLAILLIMINCNVAWSSEFTAVCNLTLLVTICKIKFWWSLCIHLWANWI